MVAQGAQAKTRRKLEGNVMKLPQIPYTRKKVQQQITAFYGLNRSENIKDGELTDSVGMSSSAYPCLTQRAGRAEISGYAAPYDLFEWDGKLVVADGGVLYYDGEAICNISEGKKQFAVVNTKLCVFPDKLCVDLTNNRFERLDAEVQTPNTGNYVTVTENSISAVLSPVIKKNLSTGSLSFEKINDAFIRQPALYTYGSDAEAVKACWNRQTGTWQGLDALETLSAVFMPDDKASRAVNIGDVFIPKVNKGSYTCIFAAEGLPDKSQYNTGGYYGIITNVVIDSHAFAGGTDYVVKCYYDIYCEEKGTPQFSGSFSAGDVVSISGTDYEMCDVEKREIIAIEESTNTLVFADGTFTAPIATYYTSAGFEAGKYAFKYYSAPAVPVYYQFTATEAVVSGMILYVTAAGDKIHVWDPTLKKAVAAYTAEHASGESTTYTTLNGVIYHAGNGITIQRSVPDLDYICESGNRLWGVSNADNTIYASALGLPTRFYTYENVSTDSYAAAVGSEGEFTAICAFGSGVCCWKEKRLHKVLGSYPQEYAIYEYEIAGVQKGSSRSVQNINETLYYKGVFGVYTYTGGAPALISYNLGRTLYTDGAAGSDGLRYYLDVLDPEKKPALFVYDLTHGIWMKEDCLRAEAFCTAGGAMYFLSSDGKIYKTGEDNGERFDWYASFTPFDEIAHNRKGYAMLRLRLDMQADAWFKIEISEDRSLWKTVYMQASRDAMTLNVPLRIGRCDRFSVRISGHGRVTLRSMVREFFAGSEV